MKPYVKHSVLAILLTAAVASCDGKKDELDIAVSQVPANIIAIVQNSLPGISITEAEKETKNNSVIYELEGKLINGKKYEIKISDSGTIIKIELDD